ncbi:MAG: hypothetical protein COU35_01415, partial [Candidatus Magasanikbacteria bacterium CG10_big_fil_rev_8_21_14_0_10_47_10]
MHQTLEHKKFTWHFFDVVDESTLSYLKEHFDFHELDYEDIEGGTQQPKTDFYKDYLFAVLHFPDYHQEEKRIHVFELDIFLGKDYLITIAKGKNKRLEDLYEQLSKDEEKRTECMEEGPAFLLYEIVDSLTESCWPVIRKTSQQISDIEEDIYSEDMGKKTVWNIALVKRNLIRLKRIISPQLVAIMTMVRSDNVYLKKELSVYFDDINDTLMRIQSITESHIDVMNSLHNVSESLISQRTNDVIKVLTIFSVALLPLTLLSGIYGMNIDNLPYGHDP